MRKASKNDAEWLAMMEEDCFNYNVYPLSEIKSILYEDRYTILIACLNAVNIGYVIYSTILEECELQKIAVKKEYRDYGVATLLMDMMEQKLKSCGVRKIFLEVDTQNTSALRLYEKRSYRFVNQRKNYYSNGHDAFVYYKNLYN